MYSEHWASHYTPGRDFLVGHTSHSTKKAVARLTPTDALAEEYFFVRVCQCCLHESNRESKMSCWVWHYVSASLQVCIFRTRPLSSSFLLILLSLSVSFLLYLISYILYLFLYIFVRSLTNSLPAYLQSTYLPTCSHTYVLSHLPTCLLATCHLPTCYQPTCH